MKKLYGEQLNDELSNELFEMIDDNNNQLVSEEEWDEFVQFMQPTLRNRMFLFLSRQFSQLKEHNAALHKENEELHNDVIPDFMKKIDDKMDTITQMLAKVSTPKGGLRRPRSVGRSRTRSVPDNTEDQSSSFAESTAARESIKADRYMELGDDSTSVSKH